MRKKRNVRLSLETYVALQVYRARLSEKLGRPVGLEEALRHVLSGDTRVPKYIRRYGRRLARALLLVAAANHRVRVEYGLKELELARGIVRDLGLNVDLEGYVRWLAKAEAFEMLRKTGLLGLYREVAILIDREEGVLRLKPRVLAAKAIARVCRARGISIRRVLPGDVSYFYVMRIYKK